jgi:hypothetical protein
MCCQGPISIVAFALGRQVGFLELGARAKAEREPRVAEASATNVCVVLVFFFPFLMHKADIHRNGYAP